MKKLFMALMAVLVLASCGGDKKDAAKATENTETAVKKDATPADVMKMTADVMNNIAVKVQAAENADAIIDAFAALYSEMANLENNYADVMLAVDTLSEEELYKNYPAEMEAMQDATMKYTNAMMEKYELLENLTPEQEARLMEMMGAEH